MLDDKKYIPIQYVYITNNGELYKVGSEPDFNTLDEQMAIERVWQVGGVLNIQYAKRWWREEKPQNQSDE